MSVTSPTALHAVAGALRQAELDARPIAPLTELHPELTVEDAYRIQTINAEARVAAGALITGHKIGLTSRAMQEMLGVDEPDYGHVFDDITLTSGAELAVRELIAPRVEPEIAFVLADELSGPEVTAAQVLAATAHVVPALEVIDSRIGDWRIGLVDTVADNASCARVVLGARRTKPADVALPAATAIMTIDGTVAGEGAGAAVLGHPANAIAWLANALAPYGVALRAGHVVLPGSMCAAAPIAAGNRVVADFGALGTVELHCR